MATFQDYLDSLGAEQKNIGFSGRQGGGYTPTMGDWTTNRDLTQPGHMWGTPSGPRRYADIQVPYSFGQATSSGITPGYVDSSGGFLGYGATPDQLTNPTLLRGYSDFINANPAREAQRIANRQAEQNLFEQQLEARKQVSLAMPTITPSVQQTPVSPMGGWGQPANYTQPAQQAGMLGGLHRGSSGGMGMLSGGLNRGSN
jgi:hypothetical protein